MTFKDSIQDLIENLVKSTLNEQITWTLPTNGWGSNNRLEVVVDDVLSLSLKLVGLYQRDGFL
jgi:hypothetical protein